MSLHLYPVRDGRGGRASGLSAGRSNANPWTARPREGAQPSEHELKNWRGCVSFGV